MLVSMNWIQEFVDLQSENIEELIQRFTLSTAEVEDIFYMGNKINAVVVGEIKKIEDHPKSKKLHVLIVDDGNEEKKCVCGAKNVKLNMKIAFAKDGGSVEGLDIKSADVAGVTSYGMCCSESDLGISANNDGIMELPDDVEIGRDIKDLYDIDDIVFEVDNKSLTNRPDLWGHYGIAREFAALIGKELKTLELFDFNEYSTLPKVDVDIIETEAAYRYSSVKIDNVITKVSPMNMRIRLFYCGMKGINILSDLTNYIMLELGQPMHAFDAEKVEAIRVRELKVDTKFTTLDEVERNIPKGTLMICDNNTPIAIAGIMGGDNSKIDDNTFSLLLESANFDGIKIRKTSRELGLRTDASARYEKVLDPEITLLGIGRFVYYLEKINSSIKVASALTDLYKKVYPSISIHLTKKLIDRYTGIEIANELIVKTLKSLGFEVREELNEFMVKVPSWRATKDVTIAVDVIEEITRIYGYDNFNIDTTRSILYPVRRQDSKISDKYIKELLVEKYLLNEVHTYLWNDSTALAKIGVETEKNIKLINSLNSSNSTIRNSIIPSLLEIVNDNQVFSEDYGVFEIGKVIKGVNENNVCIEKKVLGIALYSRNRTEEELFFEMKKIIDTIVHDVYFEVFDYDNTDKITHKWLHPRNTIGINIKGKEVGYFAPIHPLNNNLINKKASVVVCQMDLDQLVVLNDRMVNYVEPSKFPSISFDLSLVVKPDTKFKMISEICESVKCPWLHDISLVDIYYGDVKSITFRMYFNSKDRTLTMDEIQDYVNQIIVLLEESDLRIKSN